MAGSSRFRRGMGFAVTSSRSTFVFSLPEASTGVSPLSPAPLSVCCITGWKRGGHLFQFELPGHNLRHLLGTISSLGGLVTTLDH